MFFLNLKHIFLCFIARISVLMYSTCHNADLRVADVLLCSDTSYVLGFFSAFALVLVLLVRVFVTIPSIEDFTYSFFVNICVQINVYL